MGGRRAWPTVLYVPPMAGPQPLLYISKMEALAAARTCTLIRNGAVYDPLNGIYNRKLDLFLHQGKVSLVGEHLEQDHLAQLSSSWAEFDASGCLVCPGLIDFHVHCFPGKTSLGVDPDVYCLPRGVATVLDAGSAGVNDFSDFLHYISTKKTRVLALLHVSRPGLTKAGCATDVASVGELETLDDVDISKCVDCASSHPETIVGIKLRLSAQLAKDGANELEALRRALTIRQRINLPLMVHHSFSTIPLQPSDDVELGVPGSLFSGDIRTHMYHGFKTNIVDVSRGCIDYSLHEGKQRGVCSDLGHGQGGFSWTVAEIAAKEKFWPDTISSDLHIGNVNGPAYDLTTVMTKLLHVGMPLANVIEAVTSKPALIIGQEEEIGTLTPGVCADVTVLRLEDWDELLEDAQGQLRNVKQRISPVAVWRAGESVQVTEKVCPNKDPAYSVRVKTEWDMLIVRDKQS